jgi:hypothetical protein
MDCKNHGGTQAEDRCTGCAEPFCPNCLVDIRGQKYCGSCKIMAMEGQSVAGTKAGKLCKEAKGALICAIVGHFFFGIVMGPAAVISALKAQKVIEKDPTLLGSGMAMIAIILGILDTIWFVLVIMLRAQNKGGF